MAVTGDAAAHQAAAENADAMQGVRLGIAAPPFSARWKRRTAAQAPPTAASSPARQRRAFNLIAAGAAVIQPGTHHLVAPPPVVADGFHQRFLAAMLDGGLLPGGPLSRRSCHGNSR
ncbi:hypothetical protein M8494_03850 [Serratia ureilytica]